MDLLRPDSTYTAPVAGNGHQGRNGDSTAASLSNGKMVAAPEEPPATIDDTGAGEDPAGYGETRAGGELPARLKQSSEYLGWDLRNLEVVDAWQEDELKFFVFQLDAATTNTEAPAEAPRVLFTVNAGDSRPVSAVMITPPSGEEAGVADAPGHDRVDQAR